MDFFLFDQLQNPVLVMDKELGIVYYNHICGSYFQMPPRKLKQITDLNELIRTDSADLRELALEALKQNTSKVTEEMAAIVGEGVPKSAVIIKAIPVDERHAVIHVLDYSIEKQLQEKYKKQILELKETHDQIVRSDKLTALGELIAGISHEISTPLTVVSHRLNRMEEAIFLKDWNLLEEISSELTSEFQRISQIISGMQSYAKNQEDELEICDLGAVAAQSAAFIKELNVLGEIELSLDVQRSFLALANPLKLQQVFINLLKNSIEALKEHPQQTKAIIVHIEEDEAEQTHLIRVVDNGPGVPEEDKEKIFEMFYTSKELGEGTGLGLGISQKIVEAHHGSVSLADTPSGCEFLIRIPMLEVGTFTRTNRYLSGETEEEDEKILVVGDDVALLNQVFKALRAKNLVSIFSNKSEGIEELADFFVVDRAVKLKACDLSFLDSEVTDLSEVGAEEVLKAVKEIF